MKSKTNRARLSNEEIKARLMKSASKKRGASDSFFSCGKRAAYPNEGLNPCFGIREYGSSGQILRITAWGLLSHGEIKISCLKDEAEEVIDFVLQLVTYDASSVPIADVHVPVSFGMGDFAAQPDYQWTRRARIVQERCL